LLRRQDQIARATRLLAAGLRPNIVAIDTGLSMRLLRNLYADARGERPRPGQMQRPERILSSRQRVAEASCLLALYTRLARNADARIDLDALVRAYELQSQVMPMSITCNQAWVLARALRARIVRMHACRRCRAPLVSMDIQSAAPSCPFCCGNGGRARASPHSAATLPANCGRERNSGNEDEEGRAWI
jgi:hypothetical protein